MTVIPHPRGERKRRPGGFNLMELMLSLTLITIAALSLVALSFTAISSREKAEAITDAMLVAEEQLSLAVYTIENLPESDHNSFWAAVPAASFSEGTIKIGVTDYNFRVEVGDVNTGTVAPNRMRKLDITVWWWSEEPGEARIGSGQLSYSASRLVREVMNDSVP